MVHTHAAGWTGRDDLVLARSGAKEPCDYGQTASLMHQRLLRRYAQDHLLVFVEPPDDARWFGALNSPHDSQDVGA